jgi:hypothetical protein
VAADVAAALGRALAAETPEAPARRYAFARDRYAWSAAADAYATILRDLIGAPMGAAA